MMGRILIIDDDDQLRRVYARCLLRHFLVECTADVESGIALIENGIVFDAILCDLNLARMTGRDLHEYLCSRGHPLAERLVIITGEEPAIDDDFTMMLLASERYLVKTCSVDVLVSTVRTAAMPLLTRR